MSAQQSNKIPVQQVDLDATKASCPSTVCHRFLSKYSCHHDVCAFGCVFAFAMAAL